MEKAEKIIKEFYEIQVKELNKNGIRELEQIEFNIAKRMAIFHVEKLIQHEKEYHLPISKIVDNLKELLSEIELVEKI
jgi:hypothetical protein